MRKEKREVIFGALLILLDQLSKLFAAETSLAIVNKGVFFGLFNCSSELQFAPSFFWRGLKPAITLIFFGVLGILGPPALKLWRVKILEEENAYPWGLLLLVSGGISNLIDRVFRGGVVDFIDIKIIPVFNLADIAICVGTVLFLVDFIFKKRV